MPKEKQTKIISFSLCSCVHLSWFVFVACFLPVLLLICLFFSLFSKTAAGEKSKSNATKCNVLTMCFFVVIIYICWLFFVSFFASAFCFFVLAAFSVLLNLLSHCFKIEIYVNWAKAKGFKILDSCVSLIAMWAAWNPSWSLTGIMLQSFKKVSKRLQLIHLPKLIGSKQRYFPQLLPGTPSAVINQSRSTSFCRSGEMPWNAVLCCLVRCISRLQCHKAMLCNWHWRSVLATLVCSGQLQKPGTFALALSCATTTTTTTTTTPTTTAPPTTPTTPTAPTAPTTNNYQPSTVNNNLQPTTHNPQPQTKTTNQNHKPQILWCLYGCQCSQLFIQHQPAHQQLLTNIDIHRFAPHCAQT